MRFVHHRRLAGAIVAMGALAVPAAASAHPGVFEVDAYVTPCANNADPNTCTIQHQYAVVNDGITQVWRESNNGPAGDGLVNYKRLPGTVRPNIPGAKESWLTGPYNQITNLQAHQTCTGVAALDDGTTQGRQNILSWQTATPPDPFYDYIPFQKTGAGFGDDPSKWIPVVQTLTGVDLNTADPATACTGLGGTLRPADAVVNNATSVSSATIATAVTAATDPLNAQITGLNGQVASLTGQIGDLTSQLAGLQAAKDASDATAAALRAQITSLKAPLTVKIVTTGKTGATVDVTGPPLSAVTVQLLTTKSKAKSLGLASTLLGSATKTLDASGKLRVAVSLSKAGAKALKGLKGSLPVTVNALSAAKSNAVSASLKR